MTNKSDESFWTYFLSQNEKSDETILNKKRLKQEETNRNENRDETRQKKNT